MTNKTQNPWAGLASYEDPTKSEKKLQFCGRNNDIYDVTRLIDDNLLLVLYGKSGIGKTSLLNAGVFPKLRLNQYLPISIRLGTLEANASYQEAIISAIENAIEEVNGSMTVFNVVEEQADNQQPDRLWNYFARHRFVNAELQPLFPVVVLDQFEEVLRNNSPEHIGKAQTLLNQLQYLIDESHALSDCIVDGNEYFYDFNFRFVISIREDDLYLLEDKIDDLSLTMFRNCRFRLRSLSEQGATEAILVPGEDCIANEEKRAVVARIIELSKRPQSNDIDTLLLSLVCAGTYDKKSGEKISVSDLAVWKSNPMEVYYQDAVKGLTATQIRYIQQNLIREDGSRRRVDAEKVKSALGEATYLQLIQGVNRLLSLGDKGQVELLHDQLGMAVYEERKAFEERERKKRLRRRVSIIGIIVFAIAGMFFFQNARLKQQKWKMQEIQSKIVAEKAISLANEDSYLARILALEILPKDLSHPDRPYTPEAEKTLREACNHNTAIFKGIKGVEYYAIFSPDDKQIISRSNGNTLIVRDAESGAVLSTKTIDSAAYLAKYSPDCNRIVSASKDSLKMWDAVTGTPLWKIGAYYPHCIGFSNDGNRLIFANDTIIKVVDATTSEELLSLSGHSDWIDLLVVSPDGNTIVSASCKKLFSRGYALYEKEGYETIITEADANTLNTIIIWDANTGKKKATFSAHYSDINSISFSPDGKQFVTTAFDYNIMIWDAETGKEIQKMKWKLNSIARDAVFTPDGNKVVSGHVSGHIKVWDVQTGKEIQKRKGHNFEIWSIAISSNGQRIISTSNDATIKLWDIESSNGANILATIDSHILSLSAQISPDEENFVFISKGEEYLRVYNNKTGIQYSLDEFPHICNGITFSPDGKLIAASSTSDGDGTLMIWDTKTGKVVHSLQGHTNWITSVKFSPDGKQLVTSSWDNTTRIWDVESGKELRQLPAKEYTSAIFSPDMEAIALAESGSTKAILCDAKTLDTLMVLDGHTSSIMKLTFSSDGKTIASYDANATTKLWNCKTGECLQSIKGYFKTFGPNDRYCLLNKEQDMKTIDVFDVELGNCVYSITNQTDTICGASFSKDGSQIITVLSNGVIRKWDFPPLQELINQTRERFKDRPLTPEERRMYYLD